MYSTSSSSELSDTSFFAIIELESRDEVNPVAKEEGRGDEEVFEVFKTIRAESHSAEVMILLNINKIVNLKQKKKVFPRYN